MPFVASGALDNFSVTVVVRVDQTLGTGMFHTVGVQIDGSDAMSYVVCGFDASGLAYMKDSLTDGLYDSRGFVFSVGSSFRVSLTRHGSRYACTVVGPVGQNEQMVQLSGDSMIVPRNLDSVWIWGRGVDTQYGSVQIVGTP